MKIYSILGLVSFMAFAGFQTSAAEINLDGLKLFSAELKPINNNAKDEVVVTVNNNFKLFQFTKAFIKLTFTRELMEEKVILLPVNFAIKMPKKAIFKAKDTSKGWTLVMDQLDGKKLSQIFDYFSTGDESMGISSQSSGISSSSSTNQLLSREGVRITNLYSIGSPLNKQAMDDGDVTFAISERSSKNRSAELMILEGGEEADSATLAEHTLEEFKNLVIPTSK